jgi:hypothetical protein
MHKSKLHVVLMFIALFSAVMLTSASAPWLQKGFYLAPASGGGHTNQAQGSKTITATGTMTTSGGGAFNAMDLTFTFPPSGGGVMGDVYAFYSETKSDGTVESGTIRWTLEGIFEGGDGGAAAGTVTGTLTMSENMGMPVFNYSGPWSGNFYADGTGKGVFDATVSASGQTSSGQFTWEVVFLADEFAAGLQQPELTEPSIPPENFSGTVDTPGDLQPSAGSFEETWQSPQAKAVRSPIIPIAGGLLGAGLAWLLGQGTAQASSYAGPAVASVFTPPPATSPVLSQTPPVLATEPPKLVITPPELVTTPPILQTSPPPVESSSPQTAPAGPPPGPQDLAFNLVKDTIGTTGTLLGIYEKFLSDPNSLKTVNVIKDALNTLTRTPEAATFTEYVADVAKLKAAENAARIGEKLGVAGKFLDTAEALVKAEKICAERGYRGMDAALRTYAEVGKKGVVWVLTKNPVVGLADAAVGGATSTVFGAANKVDIGVAVDKTFEAWDNVTRHASNKWNRGFETAAEGQKAENLKHLTERIRQQVEGGKVSKLEGTRRLQRVLTKFNQESPLL